MILGRMNRSVKVLLLLIFASLFIALFFDKISFEGDFSKSSKYISLNEIYLNRTHVLEKLERTILNQQISIQNLLNKSLQVLQEDLDNKDETIQSLKLQLENTRKLEGGPVFKFQDLSKIRIGCIITTHPGVLSEFQALAVHDTWVRRCTKVLFVTSSGSPFLEKLNFTARSYFKASEKEEYSYFKIDMKEGRERLWAKTKISFAQAYFDFASEVDWFLKADDDSYIVMENLQYFLSSLDSSLPLLAGSLFMCRSTVKECLVDENHVKDQPYMSGGAGYVLSRTALELFVNVGIGNNDLCRDESLGPEDVQMSRCMENLGVHFVDTRDRFGKLRFIHIDLTDILRLVDEGDGEEDLSWMLHYQLVNYFRGADCCSDYLISFHHLAPRQIIELEFMINYFRVYRDADPEDLNLPTDLSVLPNNLLKEDKELRRIMNITENHLRLEELMKFKQEHPIIEEAHENILTPEDAE